MRLALISDIHSNVHALEQVLAQLNREGVDLILNLGDLVGYNANPNECIELLQSVPVLSLAGNHDLALLDVELAQFFNIIAYQAIIWAREQVRPEFKEFFQTLPLTREGPGYLACHGTPTSADSYINYHFQGKKVLTMLHKGLGLRVCFYGHTHRRALWYKDIRGKVATQPITPGKILLEPSWHYLINPGASANPGTATRRRPTPFSTTRNFPFSINRSRMMWPRRKAAFSRPGFPSTWRSAWLKALDKGERNGALPKRRGFEGRQPGAPAPHGEGRPGQAPGFLPSSG
jgi:predicted phosphodiesterase